MTVHTHIYGAPSYLERHGTPTTFEDLDRHRLIAYGDDQAIPVPTLNWVLTAGREDVSMPVDADPNVTVNNVFGMLRAAESGLGFGTARLSRCRKPDPAAGAGSSRRADLHRLFRLSGGVEDLQTGQRFSRFHWRKRSSSQSGEPNGARKGATGRMRMHLMQNRKGADRTPLAKANATYHFVQCSKAIALGGLAVGRPASADCRAWRAMPGAGKV